MSYSGTLDVLNILGGTGKVSVGTSGTCITSTNIIENFITKADVLIDSKLYQMYGTQGFGTSASGTRGLPALVKSISEDIASYYLVESFSSPARGQFAEYGQRLHDRAMGLLDQIMAGEVILAGYSPDTIAMPTSSDLSFDVNEEVVTLSGTSLTNLAWKKVIAHSEVVMNNTLDGTVVYTRDTDYKMYYYDNGVNDSTTGMIRRLATGSLTDGQSVKVTYKVWKDANFGIRDARVYGQTDSGLGGGNSFPMGVA